MGIKTNGQTGVTETADAGFLGDFDFGDLAGIEEDLTEEETEEVDAEVEETVDTTGDDITDDADPADVDVETADPVEEDEEDSVTVTTDAEEITGDTEAINFGDSMESLIDGGFLDLVDADKEYAFEPEGLGELVNDTVTKRVAEGIEEANKSRNSEVVALEEFLTNNPGTTLADYNTETEEVDYTTVDDSDADTQLLLLEDYYNLQGFDKEEIAQNIEENKASKSVARHAKRAKAALVKAQTANTEARAQARQAAEKQQALEIETNVRNYEQKVLKTQTIGGIEISPRERQELADYILKPNADGKTGLELDEDGESDMLYAYLKLKKIDLKKLDRKATTKATRTLKQKMNGKSDKLAKSRGKGAATRAAAQDDLSGLDDFLN